MNFRNISICLTLFTVLSLSVQAQKNSLYSSIFEIEGNCNIVLDTDLNKLIRKSSKEEYQDAVITILDNSLETIASLPGRIRARGNMRKKQCRYPPIKVDFKKGDLDSLGFKKKVDKLKLVFPCRGGDDNQDRLYREYLLYDIYKIIDQNGLNAKLANVTFKNDGQEEKQFVGMFVEEEKAYNRRTGAKVVESGNIRVQSLDRDLFLKMSFFQYMIANTDFSITNFHNLEMVKLPDNPRVVAIPYDFDYAGFVGHSYAIPHEALPIESVHERYFFKYKITSLEFDQMVDYFLSIEKDIYSIIDSATYLEEKSRERCKEYLEPFFDIMRNPDRFKKEIVN